MAVAGWNWLLRCDVWPGLTGRQGSSRLISSLGLDVSQLSTRPHAHALLQQGVCDDGWMACREGRSWQPGSYSIGACIRMAQRSCRRASQGIASGARLRRSVALKVWQARHTCRGRHQVQTRPPVDRARGIDLAPAAAKPRAPTALGPGIPRTGDALVSHQVGGTGRTGLDAAAGVRPKIARFQARVDGGHWEWAGGGEAGGPGGASRPGFRADSTDW